MVWLTTEVPWGCFLHIKCFHDIEAQISNTKYTNTWFLHTTGKAVAQLINKDFRCTAVLHTLKSRGAWLCLHQTCCARENPVGFGVTAAAVGVSGSSTTLLKHSNTHTIRLFMSVSLSGCINITVSDWPSFGFIFGWRNEWMNERMNECKMLKLNMHTRCLLKHQRFQKYVPIWTPLMQLHSLSLGSIAGPQREINTFCSSVPLEEGVDWMVSPFSLLLSKVDKPSDLSLSP